MVFYFFLKRKKIMLAIWDGWDAFLCLWDWLWLELLKEQFTGLDKRSLLAFPCLPPSSEPFYHSGECISGYCWIFVYVILNAYLGSNHSICGIEASAVCDMEELAQSKCWSSPWFVKHSLDKYADIKQFPASSSDKGCSCLETHSSCMWSLRKRSARCLFFWLFRAFKAGCIKLHVMLSSLLIFPVQKCL